MSSSIHQFHEFVLNDLFAPFAHITAKRMFGGYGYYYKDDIFAIVTSGSELYFKGDVETADKFESRGGMQFIYTGHKNKKPTTMPYWQLPEEIMESKTDLWEWIQASATITRNAKKK